jgi:hypothetical protein
MTVECEGNCKLYTSTVGGYNLKFNITHTTQICDFSGGLAPCIPCKLMLRFSYFLVTFPHCFSAYAALQTILPTYPLTNNDAFKIFSQILDQRRSQCDCVEYGILAPHLLGRKMT